MRIGQLAKKTGLSHDTIRFYEKKGLIHSAPSVSDTNSYRDYPGDLEERLAMISQAREAGLSIADLRIILDAMEGRASHYLDISDFIDLRIEELKESIAAARKTLRTLTITRDALNAAVLAE